MMDIFFYLTRLQDPRVMFTSLQKCPFWEKYMSNIFNDYYGNLLSAGKTGAERSVDDFVSLRTA